MRCEKKVRERWPNVYSGAKVDEVDAVNLIFHSYLHLYLILCGGYYMHTDIHFLTSTPAPLLYANYNALIIAEI